MKKNNVIEQAGTAEVIRYVNLILMDMTRSTESSLTIRRSAPAYETQDQRDHVRPAPEFAFVAARLKIMSELDPITGNDSANGHFPVTIHGREYVVKTHFEHTAEDSLCTIELQKPS